MEVFGEIKFRIVECHAEQVISEMPILPGILNPFGTVNAGAILWFADVTASELVLGGANAEEGMKGFPLAINLHANLMGNRNEGTFVAKSNYIKKGRSVSVVRTTVKTLEDLLIADITTSHILSK